jgi:hypothetical protein
MKNKEEIAQYIKSELANDEPEIYLDIDDYKVIVKALEEDSCETIKEIPTDYCYDTETEDFLVYRNKYTGHEIHIEKPVPRYRLEQETIDYKTQYENYLKKSEVVISQLRAERDRLQETIDKARAEIEQEYENEFEHPYGQGLGQAMMIIDKYNKGVDKK